MSAFIITARAGIVDLVPHGCPITAGGHTKLFTFVRHLPVTSNLYGLDHLLEKDTREDLLLERIAIAILIEDLVKAMTTFQVERIRVTTVTPVGEHTEGMDMGMVPPVVQTGGKTTLVSHVLRQARRLLRNGAIAKNETT